MHRAVSWLVVAAAAVAARWGCVDVELAPVDARLNLDAPWDPLVRAVATSMKAEGWVTPALIQIGGLIAAQPLTLLSYAISSAAWTQRLLNVGLHAGNAVLVFELVRGLLTKQPILTLLAALVFAVHPAQTEAICTVSGRGELLFTLSTLVALVAALRRRNADLHRFTLVASICAALSYGGPTGGAVVAMLVSLLRGQVLGAPDADAISDASGACVMVSVLTALALPTSGSAHDSPLNATDGVVQYVLTWGYLVARHLVLLVWPHPLAPDWSHLAVEPVSSKDSRIWLIAAVVLALFGLSRVLPVGRPGGASIASPPMHASPPPRPTTSAGIGGALAAELFAEPAAPVSTTDLDRLEEASSAAGAPRTGGVRRRQLSKTRSARTTATIELEGEPTSHSGLGSQLAVATLAPAPVAASEASGAGSRVAANTVPAIALESSKAADAAPAAAAAKPLGAVRHAFVPGMLVLAAAVAPLLSARSLVEAAVYPASIAVPLLLAAVFELALRTVSAPAGASTKPHPQRPSWKVVVTAAAASAAFLGSVFYCETVAAPQWQSRETYWRAALAVHPSHAGALQGMALLRLEAAAASGQSEAALTALLEAQQYAQAAVDAAYALPGLYPSLPLGDQILPDAVSVLGTAAVRLGNKAALDDALNGAVSRMVFEAAGAPVGSAPAAANATTEGTPAPQSCVHGASPYVFPADRFQLTETIYGIHSDSRRARRDAYFFLALELALAQGLERSPAAADSLLRAAAIAQTLPDSELLIEPLHHLAGALESTGQFAAAAHWHEQALRMLERLLAKARTLGGELVMYGLQGPRKVAAQALRKQSLSLGPVLTAGLQGARKNASAALQMTTFKYRAPLTLMDNATTAPASDDRSAAAAAAAASPSLAVSEVPDPVCISINVDALALSMRRFPRVDFNESLCSTPKDRTTPCGFAVSAHLHAAKAAVLGLNESIAALREAAVAAGADLDAFGTGCACEGPLRLAPFGIPTRLCARRGLVDPLQLRQVLEAVTKSDVQAGCPAHREGGAVVGGTAGDAATVPLAGAVARLLEATAYFDYIDQKQAYAHRLDEARLAATWKQLRGVCGCA